MASKSRLIFYFKKEQIISMLYKSVSRQPTMKTMEKFIVQAAILIATHNVLPFDMATIDICDGQRIFSFLCVEWGIVADIDCDSERYRFLGNKTKK